MAIFKSVGIFIYIFSYARASKQTHASKQEKIIKENATGTKHK
jgi:hypothetical protein